MKRILLFLTILGTLLSSCSSDDKGSSSPTMITPIEPDNDIYGLITDTNGNRMEGVVVSDGFTATVTDKNGEYQFKRSSDAVYVFYSIPADCEVPVDNGGPRFYQTLKNKVERYDFTLTRLAAPQKSFNLFCLADPQSKDVTHNTRFINETMPQIRKAVEASDVPCYGVTLGDIVYTEGTRNTTTNMVPMRNAMRTSNSGGMPIFQTMGNHDNNFAPVAADDKSSTFNLAFQRQFEFVFGPIDYSWNRGDAHIVCMRDIQYKAANSSGSYDRAFTDEQLEWLRQDLSYVDKDKLLIFCVHIPLVNANTQNVQNVLNLLKEFKEVHIMAGHTHYGRNYIYSENMYEHIHGAICGAWWYSNLNGDGTPNGFAVYRIDGNTIADWHYRGVNEQMNDESFQIRMYRGDAPCGGKYETMQFGYGSQTVLANVFNADKNWTVQLYENGVLSGDMTLIAEKKQDNPSDVSSQDWWAIGYNVGVVGRGYNGGTRSNYCTKCFHLYKYTLKDPSAQVKVVATDPFGRSYECDKFSTNSDYSSATPPAY